MNTTFTSSGEQFLHQHKVKPAAELESHLRHAPGFNETETLVQCNGGDIVGCNASYHGVLVRASRLGDQAREQHTADSTALHRRGHIDRMLDGESVALIVPELSERAVAHDHTIEVGDENRKAIRCPLLP